MTTRISLSGSRLAGKNYIAMECGFIAVSLADPIRTICTHLYGSCDKSLPGMRKIMQDIGTYGRGDVSHECPLSLARSSAAEFMRSLDIDFGYPVNLNAFGLRDTFWLDILAWRLTDPLLTGIRLAVPDVRYPNELEALGRLGFAHYHVACSRETWFARLRDKGEDVSLQSHPSENTGALVQTLGDDRVIWNDTAPKPKSSYWTVKDFKAMVSGQTNLPL